MSFVRRLRVFCGVLSVFGALSGGPALGVDLKVLPCHVPAAVKALNPIGSLASTNQMRLAIGVALRDEAGLDQFLSELYNPASPNYRKYLTPGQFTARFGPSEGDYEAVKQFAEANGLTVLQTHSNRLVLDVTGPVAAVQNAFHIRLQTYQHPTESRQFFAPDTDPTVALDLPVADIQGLSDFAKPHPRLKRSNSQNAPKSGSGEDGAYMGDDFRNAYAPGTTMTGAGQMVGLLQFDGFYASDIAAYAAAAGGGRANIPIQTVLVDGFNGQPSGGADSGSVEVSLDIEQAMAMAPGLSKIVVFEAGEGGFPNDVLNAMAEDSSVKNLSSSWGWSGGPNATTDDIFKEMAAQGQSYFNAAGDNDAFTVGGGSINGVDNPNDENAPSSSPYITQVGGTTLTMNGTGASYSGETVWNWGGGTGSSGGISSYYSIPSWQAGISMSANLGSTTMRNIPDVALIADNVFVDYGDGQSGFFGGTSCAAPLWAGFMALVNEQAASQSNSSAGFINPAIYAIGQGQNTNYSYAACFHDTTVGNNFWSSSPSSYPAATGYDLCTGWGTPNGTGLIAALAGVNSGGGSGTTNINSNPTNPITSSTNGFSASPLTGFAFSGSVGGPFPGASGIFQMTNGLTTAVGWSLVSTSSWLKVVPAGGTLAGNASTNVAVDLAAAATALAPGSYSSSLRFTDQATNVVQAIPVTLQIVQPLSVSPTQGFTAVGPVGGPFAPKSQTIILTNSGATAAKWSVTKSASWLTVSAAGGTIAAGGQVAVTVGLSASASTLRAALYTASITFSGAGGVVAKVPCTLSVGQYMVHNGGFESGSFTGWTLSGNTAGTSLARGINSYVHSGSFGAKLGSPGSPGYLSQTVATVSGQTYLLSLWLRNPTGATSNWFEVQWDGSPIFEEQNLAAASWTNLQFLVTASGVSSVLELGFQNEASSLGLDDIGLTLVASASVKSTARQADDFKVAWNTSPGALYQMQYKTDLSQRDWINLGSATTAGADALMLTDTNAFKSSPQRFYRLLALPSP